MIENIHQRTSNFVKYISLALFFILSCTFTQAQDVYLDSIKNSFKNAKHDTVRLKCLRLLSENAPDGEWEKYTKQLRFYSEKHLKDTLSIKIPRQEINFTFKCFASAINNQGYMNMQHGDFSQALLNFEKSLSIFKSVNDEVSSISTLNNISSIYVQTGQTTKAIEILIKCLTYYKLNNDLENQSNCLNNLAYIYQGQGDISRSLEQNFEALKIREKLNDTDGSGYSYINIGSLYVTQSDSLKGREFYNKALQTFKKSKNKRGIAYALNSLGSSYATSRDTASAFKYFRQSLATSQEIEDKLAIANVLANMANTYIQNKCPDIALQYLNNSLAINQSIGNKTGLASVFFNLGKIYREQGKISEAIKYGNESLNIAQEIGHTENTRNASSLLYSCYKKNNNAPMALKMYELMIVSRDSIVNQENRKVAIYSQFQYAFDKKESLITAEANAEKERLILQAKEDKRRQNIIVISILSVLLIAIIFSGFILRSRKQIQNANKTILDQKQEVEAQKHLVDEKNKEITESINYAKRIQQTIMASKTLLDNNLNEHFIYFNPKDIVSGDFYWAAKTEEHFYLVIADSTGHGVPGAFMSLLNIGFLSEAVKERKVRSTHDILNYVRTRLIENLAFDNSTEGNNDGMDCSIMSFNFKTNILEFSCANNPILINRNDELLRFAPDKMPVGRSPKQDLPFTLHSVQLQKNDMIYAFTDGYADQFGGPDGKKFRRKAFEELLYSFAKESILTQKEKVESTFTKWKGNLEQIDDILVFGKRV